MIRPPHVHSAPISIAMLALLDGAEITRRGAELVAAYEEAERVRELRAPIADMATVRPPRRGQK